MWTEFLAYCQTKEYLHGVFVEMTGTAIEIAVLTISLPIILAVWQRIRTRPIRSLVWFYVFQAFHDVLKIFMDIAAVKDIFPILAEEQKKNPAMEIYSHFVYGNLENKITVVRKVLEDGSFEKETQLRSRDDFLSFRDRAQSCLDEIDRLTVMFSSMPSVQEKLFQIRLVVYPLRDIFSTIAEDFGHE